MLAQKRLKSLQQKSARLAQKIEAEEKMPCFDPTKIRSLKKQKLYLKEVIEGISQDKIVSH